MKTPLDRRIECKHRKQPLMGCRGRGEQGIVIETQVTPQMQNRVAHR
jgi:hypothetical protein